jgi:GNAT superfamily N-acetyltransferase
MIGAIRCRELARMMASQLVHDVAKLGYSVRKDWCGKGVGTALMEDAIAWAKGTGFMTRLQMEVCTTYMETIRLYERMGFVYGCCRRHTIRCRGRYIGTFIMARLLDENFAGMKIFI